MDAASMIPLNPRDYLVLFSLVGEERHGYGIVKEMERESKGRVRIDPANLYRTIKRMISEGLVEEADARQTPEAAHQRRRYYRVTTFGREVVALEAGRLAELTAAARSRQLIPETESPG